MVSLAKSRPSAAVICFSEASRLRISSGGNGEAATAPTGCHPSPCRAVRRSAARECPPTQIGGGGGSRLGGVARGGQATPPPPGPPSGPAPVLVLTASVGRAHAVSR